MQLGLGLANAMAHHAACKSNEMILSLNVALMWYTRYCRRLGAAIPIARTNRNKRTNGARRAAHPLASLFRL